MDSKEEDFETYDVTFSRGRLTVLKEVISMVSVGFAYEFDTYSKPRLKEYGLLDTGNLIGKEGESYLI